MMTMMTTNASVGLSNHEAAPATSNANKSYFHGTHRIVSPPETLERVRPLLPLMGITRIANITGLDRIGIPVAMACRPNSRSLSVSQGKGLDLDSAKASAVMESIESYHAERVVLPLKLASHEELRYTHCAVAERLPQPKGNNWHPYRPILWIEGSDLISGASAWLPFELVHLNAAAAHGMPGCGSFLAGSNGLASGNHMLEAISHAICELVERDAMALWRLKSRASRDATLVDHDTVDDPDCRWLLRRFEEAGIRVGVWEATTDIGIPVFACHAIDYERDRLHPMPAAAGSGCHPCRAVALSRALTEAAQCRATLIAGTRDDLSAADYSELFSVELAQSWQETMTRPAARSFAEAPDFTGTTLKQDVTWEVEQLAACGLTQVIVVNLTKPEFRLPVVRVVIPGLEPDEPERVPGERSLEVLRRENAS